MTRPEVASADPKRLRRVLVTATSPARGAVLPGVADDDLTPAVVRYARALLSSPHDDATFVLHSARHGWCWTAIRRTGSSAAVEVVLGPAPYGLTARELEVLTLLAAGLTNPQAAARLGVGARTVATHVDHLLLKLGQASRAGAAAVAVAEGLLRLPVPGGPLESLGSNVVGALDLAVNHASSRPWAGRPCRPRRRLRPFVVGSAISLTGLAAADGQEMLGGSELAILELNARGGIAGHPIEHVVVDLDVLSPTGVRDALTRLAHADVDAVTIGYALGEDVAPAALAVDYRGPIVNSMTAEAQATWVQDDPTRLGHLFQLSPTQINHGVAFVGFLDDLAASGGWAPPGRELVLVETDVVGGHVVDQRLLDQVARAGWLVRDVIEVSVTEADWSPVIAAAGGDQVAATLVAHYVPDEVARLVRGFAEADLPSLLYSVWTPSVPRFAELAGPSAEGLLWGTTTGVYGDALGRGFLERYDLQFGRRPGRALAGTAYDQVHLLARAWAATGGSATFADVVDELRHLVHRGVNGSYFFGHDRQCGLSFPYETPDASLGQAHLVFQLQDGVSRIVHPALYAEAAVRAGPLGGPGRGSAISVS